MICITARWANENEHHSLIINQINKNSKKDFFTDQWLSKNSNYVIDLHNRFKKDYIDFLNQKQDLLFQEYKLKQEKLKQEYQYLRNNLDTIKCKCGAKLRCIEHFDGMIGCYNYTDQSKEHTKIYKPKTLYNDWRINNDNHEFGSRYLVDFKKFYELPKDLKISNIGEFLIMNNVQLLADIENINIARNSSVLSKKREKIIFEILKNKFEKAYHNKMIIAKFNDISQTKFIPDFLAIKNNVCYLFEQKKSLQNINTIQTERYSLAIKKIAELSNKKIEVITIYIIEDLNDNQITENIINLNTLFTYEFN